MYAELGPLVRPAVMPPNYEGSVQYNALIHDQNIGKDPAGTYSYQFGLPLKYRLKSILHSRPFYVTCWQIFNGGPSTTMVAIIVCV